MILVGATYVIYTGKMWLKILGFDLWRDDRTWASSTRISLPLKLTPITSIQLLVLPTVSIRLGLLSIQIFVQSIESFWIYQGGFSIAPE